jgi:hypothetical protein
MFRKRLAISLVVLAAVPSAAFAAISSRDAHASAAKQCVAVRAKIGAVSFAHAFASFGTCVSELAPLAQRNANTAAASCRSERASASFAATHGGKTFAQFYGVGRTHRNAYGKCVSGREQSASVAAVSAASACQAEQTDASFAASHSGKTFADFYGADAFAVCVALKAQAALTVTPAKPSEAPSQPPSKDDTVVSGCGTPGPVAGPAHPLVASCTVVKPS